MRSLVLSATLALCFASGCGKGSGQTVPDDALADLGGVYHNYVNEQGEPPARFADLKNYKPDSKGVKAVEAGDILVIWNAKLLDTPEAAKSVLAYERDVPSRGGRVLLGDGDIRVMTPKEFAAAPKLKP
jgi:hypothetical protein